MSAVATPPISSPMIEAPPVCAGCGRELLPGLGLCFDCDLSNAAPPVLPRVVRRVRWNESVREPERLAKVLASLCPGLPRDTISWLARGRQNELLAELTGEQDRRLGEAIATFAPNAIALAEAPPPDTGLRLNVSGHVREKIGATFGIGVAAVILHVPVGLLAFATMGILAARLARFVPRRATIEKQQVDNLLGVLPEEILANLRATRTALVAPELLDGFRSCVEGGAALASALRLRGQHLEHPGIAAADAELARLLRALGRLATTAQQRTDRPPSSRGPAEAFRTQGKIPDDATARLRDVATQLTQLRPLAARIPVARSEVVPTIQLTLTKLTESCATALAGWT